MAARFFFPNSLWFSVNQHLESDQTASNTVASGEWLYYNVDIEEGDNLVLTVTQDNNSYDVDVVSIQYIFNTLYMYECMYVF